LETRRRRTRSGRKARALAEINLTSLLDVAFVLLIAFMLIAPTLRDGVDLQLPTVRNVPVLPQSAQDPLRIRIALDGTVELNGDQIALPQLGSALIQAKESQADIPVLMEADREVAYQVVAEVLAEVRKAGIRGVGLPMTSLENLPKSEQSPREATREATRGAQP
jgi:biopolymer transport protein TolR